MNFVFCRWFWVEHLGKVVAKISFKYFMQIVICKSMCIFIIYLAAWSLSRSVLDLHCDMQNLWRQRMDSSCGARASVLKVLGLSCSLACGILVSWPGIKPASPTLEGRFFTTGPPGKSPKVIVVIKPDLEGWALCRSFQVGGLWRSGRDSLTQRWKAPIKLYHSLDAPLDKLLNFSVPQLPPMWFGDRLSALFWELLFVFFFFHLFLLVGG